MIQERRVDRLFWQILSFLLVALIFLQLYENAPVQNQYFGSSAVSRGGESDDDDDDNGTIQCTHWCVLKPKMITRNSEINFQGNNMGHMGESLLPCWSLLFELGAVQQQQHGHRL